MKKLFFFLFSLAAGILIGILSARLIRELSFGLILNVIILIVWLILSYVMQVVVHEGGHLLFGKLAGFSFQSFRLFDFMWIKEGGKIRLFRQHVPGTLGQALMSPPEHLSRFQAVLYNLGGVLGNLILSGAALGLSLFLSGPWALMADILAAMGLMLALFNGYPYSNGLVNNDGANIALLAKRDLSVQAFKKQMQISALNAANVRLKDMDPDLFEIEQAQNPLERTIEVFKVNRLMDMHRFSEARAAIDQLLENPDQLPGIHIGQLKVERDFIDLLQRRPVKRPDQEQLILLNGMMESPASLRYWYAYTLLEENNGIQALYYRKLFEEQEDKTPYQADYQSEKELLELVDQIYEKRQQLEKLKNGY